MDDRPESARSNTPRFDTAAVHAGDAPDPSTGALDPPVVLSSAYAFEDAADAAGQFDGTRPGHIYSRWRNPTVRALELKIAALEQAEDCVALASGMAAVHAALIANLNAGEHVVAAESLYAETGRLLRGTLARFGVETTFVDATDPAKIEAALRPDTRVVYLETPANPTLAITDVAEVARRCPRATVIVDSTFATPYHQRLLGRGAHLVVHSATKGLCGHGDAVGGAVVGDAARILRVREEGVRAARGPWACACSGRPRARPSWRGAFAKTPAWRACTTRAWRIIRDTPSRRRRCGTASARCSPSRSRAGARPARAATTRCR